MEHILNVRINSQKVYEKVFNTSSIREMQTKARVFTLQLLGWILLKSQMRRIGKVVGGTDVLYIVGEILNWHSHYGREYEGSLKT